HRGPDLLVLQSILSAKGNLTKVRSAIDSQLAQIAQEGPKEADLAKAKQQMQSMFLFGLEATSPRAQYLAQYELFYGDANLLATAVSEFMAITADDVRAATAEFLTPARAASVIVNPKASPTND